MGRRMLIFLYISVIEFFITSYARRPLSAPALAAKTFFLRSEGLRVSTAAPGKCLAGPGPAVVVIPQECRGTVPGIRAERTARVGLRTGLAAARRHNCQQEAQDQDLYHAHDPFLSHIYRAFWFGLQCSCLYRQRSEPKALGAKGHKIPVTGQKRHSTTSQSPALQ